MSSADSPARLLVRDLDQVVTSASAETPLRGADLGRVDVLEGAFVLCEEGRIAENARKYVKAADAAADRFTTLTGKMAKLDVAKIDAAELQKQSDE